VQAVALRALIVVAVASAPLLVHWQTVRFEMKVQRPLSADYRADALVHVEEAVTALDASLGP